jgi:hypothetical protein
MDTESVNKVLTILPDTVGVQKIWSLDMSISLFFPYWRLSKIDTVKITVGRQSINEWKDTLIHDCSVFYPVDTAFIRTFRYEKKK